MDILESITKWLLSPTPGQNIFWLHGVAGLGKSTISTTIAQHFSGLQRCGAFIHFNRNDAANAEPTAVFRTLSYQLALFHPLIGAAVVKRLKANPKLGTAPSLEQFNGLLLEPLNDPELASLKSEGPIIIVLDAMDECGNTQSRKELLRIIRDGFAKLPPIFRFLMTSRDEFDLQPLLSLPNVKPHKLDPSSADIADHDIDLYFRHSLREIAQENALSSDWPNDRLLQKLVKLSGGLFIWASTAVKFIEGGNDRQEQLDSLLALQGSQGGLDDLYRQALMSAVDWNIKKDLAFFIAVLGAIVAGRGIVTDAVIDETLGPFPRKSSSFLRHLLCLIRWAPGEPIEILHASFADYLCNRLRSGGFEWFVDLPVTHFHFAVGCFNVMASQLHFNIGGIESSFLGNTEVEGLSGRVAAVVPPGLAYATQHWVDHIKGAVFRDDIPNVTFIRELLEHMDDLIRKRFLYWLEVFSLQDTMPLASQVLLEAIEWVEVRNGWRALELRTHDSQLRCRGSETIQNSHRLLN